MSIGLSLLRSSSVVLILSLCVQKAIAAEPQKRQNQASDLDGELDDSSRNELSFGQIVGFSEIESPIDNRAYRTATIIGFEKIFPSVSWKVVAPFTILKSLANDSTSIRQDTTYVGATFNVAWDDDDIENDWLDYAFSIPVGLMIPPLSKDYKSTGYETFWAQAGVQFGLDAPGYANGTAKFLASIPAANRTQVLNPVTNLPSAPARFKFSIDTDVERLEKMMGRIKPTIGLSLTAFREFKMPNNTTSYGEVPDFLFSSRLGVSRNFMDKRLSAGLAFNFVHSKAKPIMLELLQGTRTLEPVQSGAEASIKYIF